MKLLLHYQISFPQLTAIIKSIYIEVAVADFAIDNERQSDSRVNFLTGVHRKDIRRLRKVGAVDEIATSGSIGQQILERWKKSKRYLDHQGLPLALPIKSKNRSKLSFEELVASICKKNIRAKVVLEEWIRSNIVRRDNDCVTLNPQDDLADSRLHEKLAFFSQNIHDHLIAGSHNLMGQQPPYFDRSVFYDKLSPNSVSQLSELADKLGMEALKKMNARALELQSEDELLPESDFRINFGVFNFNNSVSRSHKRAISEAKHAASSPLQSEPIREAMSV